jgi:hypothetical protein
VGNEKVAVIPEYEEEFCPPNTSAEIIDEIVR